jgi:hypothetical protein
VRRGASTQKIGSKKKIRAKIMIATRPVTIEIVRTIMLRMRPV